MIEPQTVPDFQLLPEYAKIFQTIIELDERLQKRSSQNGQKCINDVFSVIEKAYWTLYLEQNEQNLSQLQKKQILFNLTSKIGKSLDSQLSKTNLQNNKVPKWFLYKGYAKKQSKDDQNDFQDRPHYPSKYFEKSSTSQLGLKFENSIKTQQRQGTAVDPYHANIKLQAQNGLSQLQVIYRFFSIRSMLRNSVDMMDVEKITIIYRRGNTFDRDNEEEVEGQKEKFRTKFKLYSELIRCFQHFGYGARIVKKHSKEKITGIVYQYAVVHISKIAFKLLEKYVMNFINKKTKYTHRARLQKIAYNMFNLPNFFTPSLKLNFIKLIKIVFEVENPLPVITKEQLKELYDYLVKQILQKEKNPQKFKNDYMIKLQNPTFYNVKKQLRQQVKQQAEERKRLGIRIKGRRSKAAQQLNELKVSLAEEEQFFSSKRRSLKKHASSVSSKNQYKYKKQHKRTKKQADYIQQEDYEDGSDQEDDQLEIDGEEQSQDQEGHYFDSDQESDDIRDYFKKSSQGKQSKQKSKDKKKKKHKHPEQRKRKNNYPKFQGYD